MYPELIFAGGRISTEQMKLACQHLAGAFEQLGIVEGDIVSLMLRNSPAYVQTALACRDYGVFFCAINWHFKAQETRHVLVDSGAGILLIEPDLYARLRDAIPEHVRVIVVDDHWEQWLQTQPLWRVEDQPEPRRPRGYIPYTSGTTGKPKGVKRVLPPASQVPAIQARARQIYAQVMGLEPGARALLSAPLYHSAPAAYLLQCAANEVSLFLEPRFDARATLERIDQNRITHAYMVPTMFHRLLALSAEERARFDVSSLRFVTCTGSPCPPATKARFHREFGPVVQESYASSETGFITVITPAQAELKPGSVGQAIGDASIQIRGPDGELLPPGQPGRIYVRQPATPDFDYLNRSADRAAIETEGLVCIGDVGYLDDDGYLYLSSRTADMVISGGVNIYPAENEATLIQMQGVDDCAVFGIPDAEFGESLACALQLRPGTQISAEQVQTFLRERMADYKVPRKVEFHDSLPREDTGKIFKQRLREPYWAGHDRNI